MTDSIKGGITPWHMWGQSKPLVVTSGGVVTTPSTSGQIARVNYKRPDSWKFLLAAELLTGIGPGGSPISPGNLKVSFAVTLGVGLSQITLDPFGTPLVFQWVGFSAGLKWFTTARGPVLDDQAVTPEQELTNTVVAESIQVSTTAILQTPTNGDQVTVNVHAYFAPVTHIRPDWYANQFSTERAGH